MDKPFAENGEEFWGTLRCVQMWLEGAEDMTAQSVYDVLAKTLEIKEREIDVDKIQLRSPIPSKTNVEADLRRKQQISTSTGVSIENAAIANENTFGVTVRAAYEKRLWTTGELSTSDTWERRVYEITPGDYINSSYQYTLQLREAAIGAKPDTQLWYTPRADGSASDAEVERLRAALEAVLNVKRYSLIDTTTSEVIALLQAQIADMQEVARKALGGE